VFSEYKGFPGASNRVSNARGQQLESREESRELINPSPL
jgi:hypothetical protein